MDFTLLVENLRVVSCIWEKRREEKSDIDRIETPSIKFITNYLLETQHVELRQEINYAL